MWGFGSSICSKGPLVQIYPFVDHRGSQFWRDWTKDYGSLSQIPKVAKLPGKKKKKGKLTFLALVNNRQWLCIIGLPAPKLVLPATHSAENNGRAHILLFFFHWQYICVDGRYIIVKTSSVMKLFLFSSLYLAATVYVWDAELCRRIMDTGCHSYCTDCTYFKFNRYIFCIYMGCGE